MFLELVLTLPPSINSLYQNQSRYNPRTKSYQLTGGRILSKEGSRVKKIITDEAIEIVKREGWDIEKVGEDFLYMDVDIYFNRRGRDADNIFKVLQDSLQGVIFSNDNQVLPRTQKILFDKVNPRVEIKFSPVDYKGIFNNEEEAEEFRSNCKSCTRYLNGRCSILNDSLIGTVREEVDFSEEVLKCTKYKEKK